MHLSIRSNMLLCAATFALVASPIVLNMTPLADLSAFAGGKGNGNGGGNGGDHGGGNGGGNGGGGGNSSDHSNAGDTGGGGNSANASNGKSTGKHIATIEDTSTAGTNGKSTKTKKLNAQLAGLNSLNRNINGLMNSSDPRMALVRQLVQAGADLATATADLATAQTLLDDLQSTFESYVSSYIASSGLVAYDGSSVYDGATLDELNTRVDVLNAALVDDPTNEAILAEQAALTAALTEINGSAELGAVTTQQGVVDGLEGDIATLQDATSEDSLKAALLAAANKNRVSAGADAYLTPELMAWAETKVDKLTAAYIAQQ